MRTDVVRIEQLRAEMIERLERIDRRFAQIEQRLARIEQRGADGADRLEVVRLELLDRMDTFARVVDVINTVSDDRALG